MAWQHFTFHKLRDWYVVSGRTIFIPQTTKLKGTIRIRCKKDQKRVQQSFCAVCWCLKGSPSQWSLRTRTIQTLMKKGIKKLESSFKNCLNIVWAVFQLTFWGTRTYLIVLLWHMASAKACHYSGNSINTMIQWAHLPWYLMYRLVQTVLPSFIMFWDLCPFTAKVH